MLVGRHKELEQLNTAYNNDGFQFAVVYGRRHIGKTFLVSEFTKNKKVWYFSAKEANDRCNLNDFAGMLGIPETRFSSWVSAFEYFASTLDSEKTVLVIDNFTDACITGREFAIALQNSIETYFKDRNLFLIICGNHTTTLDREVFGKKAPLHDYVTLNIHLDCLTYQEASAFMQDFSDEDKIRLYSCIGGTPLYLEQINCKETFKENILRLFFKPTGFIYNDIFMLLRKELIGPVVYNSILRSIANGKTHLREIVDEIDEEKTKISKYCKVLMDMDVLDRTVPYGSDAATSRKNAYFFKDNAHLFWYRFVFDNERAVSNGNGELLANEKVFGGTMDEYITSLTFERICTQYYARLSSDGKLSIVPGYIGRIDENVGADIIVSDKGGNESIIVRCLWNKPAVSASDIDALISSYVELFDKAKFGFISANGYKADAIRMTNEKTDIELLGLNDLEVER